MGCSTYREVYAHGKHWYSLKLADQLWQHLIKLCKLLHVVLLQVAAEHSLQLQRNERVVSISWQSMTQHEPLEPHQCAAAILTTQRLLLVSGDLTVLAAIDASCGSVGLSSAITSYLWVGPALLYMTVGGQVGESHSAQVVCIRCMYAC